MDQTKPIGLALVGTTPIS